MNENNEKENNKSLSLLLKEVCNKNMTQEKIGLILLKTGLGGILTFVFVDFLMRLSELVNQRIEYLVETSAFEGLRLNIMVLSTLVFSILILMLSQFFLIKGTNIKIKLIIFLSLSFINVGGVMMILINGTINILGLASFWVMGVLLVGMVINIIKEVYKWLLIRENEEEKVNVVKLSFIWGVIMFVLGLIL